MMIFTPRSGRLLALDGYVDHELATIHQRAMSEAMDRGCAEVLQHIMKDCLKVTEEYRSGYRVERFSIRVVVFSEQEMREELESAYRAGMLDARRHV